MKKYQRGDGAGSAFATVVQGVPTAAIAPASACARAVHSALVGIRNRSVYTQIFSCKQGWKQMLFCKVLKTRGGFFSLDPEHKKESMEKYLGPDKQRKDQEHR